MDEVLKKLSIDDIHMYQDDEDVDFAIGEVWLLADGNNTHKNPITLEVLKAGADSMLGKFLIADYSKWQGDVTSHTDEQSIIGYFPKDKPVQFKEKDGKTFAVYEVLISKLYATDVYELFKTNNFRSVSAEFTCKEEDEDENGNCPISNINFHGCTILGLNYNPSCSGADIMIKQFVEKENLNELQKFSQERKKSLEEKKTYKINKDELKDIEWGSVNKTELYKKVVNAKNASTLVKSVYALVEDGWQDSPSEKLKYPLMADIDGTFYYVRGALSSALGYAKKEDETKVVNKVERLYDKFKLNDEGKDGKEMEITKFSQLEGREIYEKVIDLLHKKMGTHYYLEEVYSDHIEVKNMATKEMLTIPAKIKAGKDDEDISVEIDFDKMKKSGEQKQFADTKKCEDDDKEEKDNADKNDDPDDKKDVEDGEGDDEDAEEFSKKKKMSLDANAHVGAMLAMLTANTIEDRKEARKNGMFEGDADIVMEKLYKCLEEKDELEKFKCETLEARKCAEVDRIMADAKEDLSAEKYEELKAEGEKCQYAEVQAFSAMVKAFAYENIKNSKKKNNEHIFMRYSENKADDGMSVYQKIMNK